MFLYSLEAHFWNVTGISYVTSLIDEDITLSNINDNGSTIYYDKTAAWKQMP